MSKRKLTQYEQTSKQLPPGAWYYHTLGRHLELLVDIRKFDIAASPVIEIKIPLRAILNHEREGRT